jgi:hypothetical protein
MMTQKITKKRNRGRLKLKKEINQAKDFVEISRMETMTTMMKLNSRFI